MSTALERIFRWSQIFRSYPFCHSRPDRSFCYRGRYFGLCARCTAMYIGGFIATLCVPLWGEYLSPFYTLVLGSMLLVPGGIDGTTQMFQERESNNGLRVGTGFLLGCGVVLFVHGAVVLSFSGS